MQYGPLGMLADDHYRTIPEDRIVAMLVLAGWAYEVDSPAATKISQAALERLLQLGLGFRAGPNRERRFDPVEVNNFMKRAGLEGRDSFWAERYVSTGRRMVSDLADGEQSFALDFQRTFHLRGVVPGTPLRLRMPLPREGIYLRNLEIKARAGEAIPATNLDVQSGRLELRLATSDESEATLGATLKFLARAQKPGAGSNEALPDRNLYLRPREGPIVVSKRISLLAQSLTKPDAAPLEMVRKFWDYLTDNLLCGALHYDQVDAASPCDWILDSGWFDCQMGSALFAALCRASGLPARLVSGQVLYHAAPFMHYWAEVWIEGQGWTPFDFLSWDLSLGGRDPAWRDHFFGRLDARMTTERLPREFTGALGVPIPPAWCILPTARQGALEINFLNVDGTPVYTDTVRLRKG